MANPKFHFTYKVTFEGGHFYVGKHTTSNLDDGYTGSGKAVNRMISKGHKFTIEILEHFESAEKAYDGERRILGDLWKTDPLCVNLKEGGHGWPPNAASNRLGKNHSQDHKDRIGKANSKPKVGKALAATIANGLKGAEGRRGQKDSIETKRKRSASMSASTRGKPKPDHRRGYLFRGTFFNTLEEAMKSTGLSYYKILSRCQDPAFEDSKVIKPSHRYLYEAAT